MPYPITLDSQSQNGDGINIHPDPGAIQKREQGDIALLLGPVDGCILLPPFRQLILQVAGGFDQCGGKFIHSLSTQATRAEGG